MNNIENQKFQRDANCWGCRKHLNSKFQEVCPYCGWIICPDCDTCAPHCNRKKIQKLQKNGFDINGIHKNGTRYDDNGLDCNGKHKDYELYINRQVVYPALYGKGTITDCYFKEGFLRVKISFDNKKSISGVAICSAIEKGIIKFIDK